MNFLLFFISLIFSGIFYVFHLSTIGGSFLGFNFNSNLVLDSFSGNLLIEAVVFFLIGSFLFAGFSNYELKRKKSDFGVDFKEINKLINIFFKKYLYYIGFLLFYSSIFFILKGFNYTDLNIFILFVNIIIFILFFISKKFFIFRDFIKINTILFSLFYIIFYIISFFSKNLDFVFVDFVNSILIFSFFILNFYNDKKLLGLEKSDKALVFYFFIYNFLFLSFYLTQIIENLVFSVIIIGFFLSTFLYFFITKINFFKNNIVLIRIISFILLHIVTVISVIYTIKTAFNPFILGVLVYSIIFNFKIHYWFENYVSLIFSYISFVFLIYYFYFKTLFSFDDGFIFLVLSVGLSIETIILTYFYRFKYFLDNYFLHSMAYILNIISLIYYFVKFEFDFLILGVILLIESIFIFLSYYKLKGPLQNYLRK